MRVILLTHGGADLVIERLANLTGVELVGVFIEENATPKRSVMEKLKRSIRYDGVTGTIRKFIPRGNGSNENGSDSDRTREAAARYGIPVTEVSNYHSPAAIELMAADQPDLGVIYGTNIVRENVFSIPKLGSINLHQGLAPFYRGGPPVFWELFNDENEVGLTVHFVAAKVDTGDIILQSTVPLKYNASYRLEYESFINDYRRNLREKCAGLVAEAVAKIASGSFERKPQDISLGKRYRLPTKKEKDEMRRRLKNRLARAVDE